MKKIFFILSLSLLAIIGCDSKHGTVSQGSAPSIAEKELECDDAPLLSCQEALDLYVSTYRFIPEEPHGKLLVWAIYISELSKTTNKTDLGPKEMGEIITATHRYPAWIQQCEDNTIESKYEPLCPKLLENKTKLLELATLYRKNMPLFVEGFFLEAYVEWADEGRLKMARNEPVTIKNERLFYWFPWVKDERFILNEKNFMAFAKSKSFCDSDEVYKFIDPSRHKPADSTKDEKKEDLGFAMHLELKKRICTGESLALSEREMLSINYPMTFKEVDAE